MAYRGQELGAGGAGAADTLVGNALLLCNCLATALYVICVKLALARGYPPSTITAWSYACGAVMMVRLAHAHALTLTYGPMRPLTSPCNTATPHCSTGHPCSPAHPTHTLRTSPHTHPYTPLAGGPREWRQQRLCPCRLRLPGGRRRRRRALVRRAPGVVRRVGRSALGIPPPGLLGAAQQLRRLLAHHVGHAARQGQLCPRLLRAAGGRLLVRVRVRVKVRYEYE